MIDHRHHHKLTPALLRPLLLLVLTSCSVMAGAGDIDDVLINDIYAQGGKTLYCQKPFQPGARMKVDFIFSEKDLLRHFNCITSRQCSSKPGFVKVGEDLHNLYPVQRGVDLDRRGALFGELPADIDAKLCGYKLSFQTFEPPPHARGNVARAMVYMHVTHDLPLIGHLEMYQRWNAEDPPDEEEIARNRMIAKQQGNTNPFIDNPAAMNNVKVTANRPR